LALSVSLCRVSGWKMSHVHMTLLAQKPENTPLLTL